VEAVHRRSRGNPFFIRELSLDLLSSGMTEVDRAIARVNSLAPTGLRAALRDRISGLPGPSREVLTAAAVIGREFDVDVLLRLIGDERTGEALDALDASVAADILQELPEPAGRLGFSHILLRDVLYDELLPAQRASLHARVANAIEQTRSNNLDSQIDAIAHHLSMAAHYVEADRAVRYARLAGQRALSRAAFEEAARWFSVALTTLDRLPPGKPAPASDRAELLIQMGQARWRAGDTDGGRASFLGAAELARREALPEIFAQAALGFTGRTDATMGVNHHAVALMREALAALPPGDSEIRAELLARLGTELYFDPDPAVSDTLTGAAVAMAERLGEESLIEYALTARHYALYRPMASPVILLALSDRLIESAERRPVSDILGLGLSERILDLLELGEIARFDATLDRFQAVAEELRQPFFLWLHAAFRAMRALLDEDQSLAETRIHAALALGQRFGLPNAYSTFTGQLFELRRQQGRLAEIEPVLRELAGEGSRIAGFRSGLATTYAQMGRVAEARTVLDQVARRDFTDLPLDSHWTITLGLLAPAVVFLRDERRARRLSELLAPLSGRMIVGGYGTLCLGPVDAVLATLAPLSSESLAARPGKLRLAHAASQKGRSQPSFSKAPN
jgi:hypothetical protein